jgi:hypothetical protein
MLDLSLELTEGTLTEGWGGTQHYFTFLDALALQYWTFPTISLTGDFEIEVKAHFTDPTDQWMMQDSTGTTSSDRLGINSSDAFVVACDATITNHGAIPASATSNLSTYVIKRIGTNVSVTINGTALTTLENTATLTLDNLGSWAKNSLYCTGYFSEFRIWDGGDRSTGTLERYFKLSDHPLKTTIYDTANGANDGSEVNLADGDTEVFRFTTDGTWENSSGSVVLTLP